jgi:hypothetical protein
VSRGPTEWAITWPPPAECILFLTRRERLLPPPGKPISMDILSGWHTPRVLASLLAAMPLGIVHPNALPRHWPAQILGNPAFYVGGEDWPILMDVEIWEFLELPEGPLLDAVRVRLDRIEEGSLTLFCRLASVAQGIRNLVELTVRSAEAIAPGRRSTRSPGWATRSVRT